MFLIYCTNVLDFNGKHIRCLKCSTYRQLVLNYYKKYIKIMSNNIKTNKEIAIFECARFLSLSI